MIQSGYCLIDLSWFNTTDYEQKHYYYNNEYAAKVCRTIKAALNSGKIIFVKLLDPAPLVVSKVNIQTLQVDETATIQIVAPSSVDLDGVATMSLLTFNFHKDGRFYWKIGG